LMKMSMFRRILFLAPVAIAAMQSSFAASPSVTAVLSNSEPAVGQIVQLEIKISGANKAKVPESISVDGLEIHQTGQTYESSLSFGFGGNGDLSSATYTYSVLPLKAGQFKIPPQTVRAGSDSLRTPELTLTVADSNGSKWVTGTSGLRSNTAKPWSEITLAKKDAYVGQVVEAQVEIGFDARLRLDTQALAVGPEFTAQGLAIRKADRPQESIRIVNGVRQRVFIYKAALVAAKSGHFEIPATLNIQVQAPISRQQVQPRSHRRTDPFAELLEEMQEMMPDVETYNVPIPINVDSPPATLDVKPLPPNAPPNFSGAVGTFTMTVEAKPKTVQVGDPITVTSTISGRGNFDRMNGPALEDERGWHKYPPASKFKQDDDVGMSGEKTFEMVIAPNEKKPAVPPLVFAYFDPVKENYVTLRSTAVPIQVEGGAAPAPSAATAPAVSATSVGVTPAPTGKPQDILYQLTDLGRVRSFTPIYARPVFWIAQLAPFILLLGFIGWKIRQAKIDNLEAHRTAALQHESSELLRKLRRAELSPQEYFSNASRVVRVKTALVKNINPNAVDAETAAKAFDLGEHERAQLRTLFERSDELRFSGSGNGANTISSDEREEVLRLLESLRA
jgi:hypothetical protein